MLTKDTKEEEDTTAHCPCPCTTGPSSLHPNPNPNPSCSYAVPKIPVPASCQPPMHYQTALYRHIKAEEEADGKTRRTYTTIKQDRQCRKCGEVMVRETHKNLWGAIYCPKTSNETFEEFRQRWYG